METVADMSEHGAGVPQASYHIEVSSADGAAPPAEPLPPEPIFFSPEAGGGGARSVVLVRSASDSPAAEGRSVKYVLTGLQTTSSGAAVGATPVKSPAIAAFGQTTSAARARQILKKRLDLSIAEKKYTKLLHPELAAGEVDGDGEPQSDPAAVMICEPEADGAQKQGRTFFFVAKPPDEEEANVKTEDAADTSALPDGPAPSEGVTVADLGVLKRLNRFRLSERYEILPAASLEDAEDVMHRLRMQNLALKTELVRQATEFERHGDEHGLRARRGRKKATTIVAVDRLRELEKIEAGMHTLFTPSQVKTLSRDYKKNSVQWRDEDFRRAIGLLEHSSQHTFNYVRKVMNLPLPSIGTLKLRCPQQPELCVRLEAALQERGGETRCKHCSRRLSAGPAASQGAAGDAGDSMGAEGGYQDIQTLPQDGQQVEWAVEPAPSRGVLKRRKTRGGVTSARKAMRQDEEVVFYEAPVAPPPRGRGRARGRPRGSGGAAGGAGRARPDARELVSQYQQQLPQEEEEEEDDDEDEEPEDDEDFEDEFGEEVEEESVEIDPQQQEVPTQFAQFRNAYGGGWNEWDPRQLQ